MAGSLAPERAAGYRAARRGRGSAGAREAERVRRTTAARPSGRTPAAVTDPRGLQQDLHPADAGRGTARAARASVRRCRAARPASAQHTMCGRWESPTEIASGSPNASRPTSPSVHGADAGKLRRAQPRRRAVAERRDLLRVPGDLAERRRSPAGDARAGQTTIRESTARRSASGGRSRPRVAGGGLRRSPDDPRHALRASMPVTFCSRIRGDEHRERIRPGEQTTERWSRQMPAINASCGANALGIVERPREPRSRDADRSLRPLTPGIRVDPPPVDLGHPERRGAVRRSGPLARRSGRRPSSSGRPYLG